MGAGAVHATEQASNAYGPGQLDHASAECVYPTCKRARIDDAPCGEEADDTWRIGVQTYSDQRLFVISEASDFRSTDGQSREARALARYLRG